MSKPFDLQKALAGESVETRDGRKVIRVIHVPEANSTHNKIIVVFSNGSYGLRAENGMYGFNCASEDLVMSSQTVTQYMFIATYNKSTCIFIHANQCDAEANVAHLKQRSYVIRFPITPVSWEE